MFSDFLFESIGEVAVLQMEGGERDDLGMVFRVAPWKHVLRPIIRAVSPRRF